MNRSERIGNIRERLIRRRDEVFEAHRLTDASRRILSEPDIEPEETAQKEAIGDVLALLDERELKEVQDINGALARMELGEYGRCEVDGEDIEIERLEAIPWTTVCNKHKRTE